jgi:hypothetical protein
MKGTKVFKLDMTCTHGACEQVSPRFTRISRPIG